MIKLTDKQREAVYTRDCDLLVSAAAGSGKTAVLSERILQYVLDPENPASVTDFLIVTFTNAAAAEMKDRIGKKIMEASVDKSLNAEMKRHLRKQLSLISKASITTIHSFCLDIVRNNFHLLDIDPAVRVADSNETEILKLQVADQMLEEMYMKDGKLFSELCIWLGGGKDDVFVDEILEIYKFLRGFPNPFKWLLEKVEQYNPDNITRISDISWIGYMADTGREKIKAYISCMESLVETASFEGINTYEETFASDITTLKKYLDCFEAGIDSLMNYVPEFSSLKPKPSDADADLCELLKNERNEIKKQVFEISKYFNFTHSEVFNQLEIVYPRLKCLQQALVLFDKLFAEKKKKAAIIDFGDFEHLALEILSDEKNGVASSLRERYREIMIDEYQDCNQTQELIFSYINRKIDGNSSNMFMVGDIKQSIYRFRLADPDIFADKNRRYAGDGIQRKIVLNNNFRSRATILDGVNAVFESIMSESLGGVNYLDDEKLFFPEKNPDKSKDEKCELVLIQKDSSIEANEADYVAEEILKFIDGGYNFRDIAILVRQRTKSALLENALKLRNIPYFTDGGGGYFDSLEISMLSSMLKVVDNPMQDIELVALLRSRVFEFDENLLTKIRLEKKGPFYGALLKFAEKSSDDAVKCREFLNRLAIWRDKVLFMPVDEFIEYLIDDSGLDIFAASLPGGEQRLANLNLFILQARLLQNSGFKGLFSFVRYMDRLSAGGEKEAKILSENSNVVRIITIHKSKGLEFPVVFLFGCDASFNKRDTQKKIILHKTEGIGVKFLDVERKIKYPLVSYEPIKDVMLKDNISEEMRVLYVALTRAKEKLICTATVKDAINELEKAGGAKNSVYELIDSSSYLQWIARAQSDENWDVKIVKPETIETTVYVNKETEKNIKKVEDISEVKDVFEYKYPFETASKLPTKLSVSEVKRRREYDLPTDTKLYIPEISEMPAFMSEENITPTEKGIINHLILRHIDLLLPDVEKCASILISKGILTENEIKYIETDGINALFSSKLGERIRNAENVHRELSFGIDLAATELFPSRGYGDEMVFIQGIIDLVFEEDGEIVIVDYKTDNYLSADSREMYKVQLEMYSKAAERITGKKVKEKYLYMLKRKEAVKID